MTLFQLLESNCNDLSNHDVAVLSDWASNMAKDTPNQDWKRAYALIREGADLLLRRRARSTVENAELAPHSSQPEQLNHQRRDRTDAHNITCGCGHILGKHTLTGTCVLCIKGSAPCDDAVRIFLHNKLTTAAVQL